MRRKDLANSLFVRSYLTWAMDTDPGKEGPTHGYFIFKSSSQGKQNEIWKGKSDREAKRKNRFSLSTIKGQGHSSWPFMCFMCYWKGLRKSFPISWIGELTLQHGGGWAEIGDGRGNFYSALCIFCIWNQMCLSQSQGWCLPQERIYLPLEKPKPRIWVISTQHMEKLANWIYSLH